MEGIFTADQPHTRCVGTLPEAIAGNRRCLCSGPAAKTRRYVFGGCSTEDGGVIASVSGDRKSDHIGIEYLASNQRVEGETLARQDVSESGAATDGIHVDASRT